MSNNRKQAKAIIANKRIAIICHNIERGYRHRLDVHFHDKSTLFDNQEIIEAIVDTRDPTMLEFFVNRGLRVDHPHLLSYLVKTGQTLMLTVLIRRGARLPAAILKLASQQKNWNMLEFLALNSNAFATNLANTSELLDAILTCINTEVTHQDGDQLAAFRALITIHPSIGPNTNRNLVPLQTVKKEKPAMLEIWLPLQPNQDAAQRLVSLIITKLPIEWYNRLHQLITIQLSAAEVSIIFNTAICCNNLPVYQRFRQSGVGIAEVKTQSIIKSLECPDVVPLLRALQAETNNLLIPAIGDAKFMQNVIIHDRTDVLEFLIMQGYVDRQTVVSKPNLRLMAEYDADHMVRWLLAKGWVVAQDFEEWAANFAIWNNFDLVELLIRQGLMAHRTNNLFVRCAIDFNIDTDPCYNHHRFLLLNHACINDIDEDLREDDESMTYYREMMFYHFVAKNQGLRFLAAMSYQKCHQRDQDLTNMVPEDVIEIIDLAKKVKNTRPY